MRLMVHCSLCGKPFEVKPSTIKNGKGKFCSKACASKRVPTEARFWSSVAKKRPDECWEWTGHKNPKGYGRFGIGHKLALVHRYSYELHFGPFPSNLCVCHKCDNPACVNPAHLFLDTIAGNNHDMTRKGRVAAGESHGLNLHPERVARGERSGAAKLTTDDVLLIRKLYTPNKNASDLAKRFGVAQITIWRIATGRSWKHIPMPK